MKKSGDKKYHILKEECILEDFFNVYAAQIEHNSYHSDQNINVRRIALDRGDSVAVLIYQEDTDEFLFTKQFRYPSSRREVPFVLELVAGAIDKNESPETAAIREIEEEIGYSIDKLEHIHTYFPTPGMSAEVIHLFYATTKSADKTGDGGGEKSEQEDIKMVSLSRKRAKEMLIDKRFNNSITIIGLQWYFLNRT